jgi:hypothetical protein
MSLWWLTTDVSLAVPSMAAFTDVVSMLIEILLMLLIRENGRICFWLFYQVEWFCVSTGMRAMSQRALGAV